MIRRGNKIFKEKYIDRGFILKKDKVNQSILKILRHIEISIN
jgi:hypothetical protein